MDKLCRQSKDEEFALLKGDSLEDFATYVKYFYLWPEPELELVKSDRFDWFKVYVEEYTLRYETEVALIETGKLDWFKTYVRREYVCKKNNRIHPQTEIFIINAEKFDYFDAYTDWCFLEPQAQIILINSGKFDWFQTYVKKRSLDLKIEDWIKKNNEEWYSFYREARGLNVKNIWL